MMEILSEKMGMVQVEELSAPADGTNRLPRYPTNGLQKQAMSLLRLHHISPADTTATTFAPLSMVCLSDTRSSQPNVPAGDLLVHTGNLSKDNSVADLQAQTSWLSSLPHKYKIIIPGDQDATFLNQAWANRDMKKHNSNPEVTTTTVTSASNSSSSINFGDVIYLNNSGATLNFSNNRQISIFGSAALDKLSKSGCAHVQSNRKNARQLKKLIPRNCDILLTNEPLYHEVTAGVLHANLRQLQQLIWARPKVVVSRNLKAATTASGGHHHHHHRRQVNVNMGVEDVVVLDGVRGDFEGIMANVNGYDGLYRMWVRILVKRTGHGLRKILCLAQPKDQLTKLVGTTGLVNPCCKPDVQAVVVQI